MVCLSTNGERACLVKTTQLLLQNVYFSLIHAEQYNSSSKHKYQINSHLSNGNFCSIRLEQFWLPQLPVIIEQALSYKINMPVLFL